MVFFLLENRPKMDKKRPRN